MRFNTMSSSYRLPNLFQSTYCNRTHLNFPLECTPLLLSTADAKYSMLPAVQTTHRLCTIRAISL